MNGNPDVKLVSFRVQGYKNFVDSGEVEVDPEVSVLVGKNEAGKSTLLDALWRLNPANEPPSEFDLVENYPRWLKKQHDLAGTSGSHPPVEATFMLSNTAFHRLQERFGAGALTSQAFTAARTYGGELHITAAFNPKAWLQEFARGYPDIWPDSTTASSVDELRIALDEVGQALTEDEQRLKTEQSQANPDLAADDDDDDNNDNDDTRSQQVRAGRASHSAATEALDDLDQRQLDELIKDAFKDLVPKFFYFDDVFLLPGVVSIQRIVNAVRTANEDGLDDREVAAARSLRSVSLEPDNLDPGRSERLKTELEAIGNMLTTQVQDFWHQNPHVEFRVVPENIEETHPTGSGTHIADRQLEFRVWDSRHKASTPFTARSTGFRWFVSFLAQFSYYAEGRKDVIVLLDEPGVSLHATAQGDLLGYIDDELVPNQQVIYTTHSAWMVPVRKMHRVRTVEEDLNPTVSSGATVSGRMLAKDRDTLMPLQAALGYDIAQTLFVGPDSLVVEGISEILYLYDMSDVLHSEGREGLDPRWHICPAGSVGRIPAMLGLLGHSVDSTVLIDSPANPSERDNIEGRLYDQSRLIEIADVTETPEGDIEDLITVEDYLAAFNACFTAALTVGGLTSKAPRITKRIESDHGPFNHGDVARSWVQERAAGRLSISEATKTNFEILFQRINATLTRDVSATEKNPAIAIFDEQLADGTITQDRYDEVIRTLGAG